MNHLLEKIISATDDFLFTSFANTQHSPLPTKEYNHEPSHDEIRTHTARLMRINHVGEVCAQGLYSGAKTFARTKSTYSFLHQAQKEELDHLSWCNIRLKQLNDRPSYLTPFYYGASFAMGACAGLLGDEFSLGFVVETEKQVEAHLNTHLNDISESDTMTYDTLKTMQEDEVRHATHAKKLGSCEIHPSLKVLMAKTANLMKKVSYYL
jgi:ubiquinone biosynthesis monooxygenase Coq7